MRLKFTRSSYRALSNICVSIGQIFFAAFIAALVLPLDLGKVLVVILYLAFAVVFWILSVAFAKKGRL